MVNRLAEIVFQDRDGTGTGLAVLQLNSQKAADDSANKDDAILVRYNHRFKEVLAPQYVIESSQAQSADEWHAEKKSLTDVFLHRLKIKPQNGSRICKAG